MQLWSLAVRHDPEKKNLDKNSCLYVHILLYYFVIHFVFLFFSTVFLFWLINTTLNAALQEAIHFVNPFAVAMHMCGVERLIIPSHSCVLSSWMAAMIL